VTILRTFWLYNRLAGQNLYSVKKIEKNPKNAVFWKKFIDEPVRFWSFMVFERLIMLVRIGTGFLLTC